MRLGGFTGTITYKGNLKEFLPFIKLGEIIHIGKNTSFGLGKYIIK
ncbi:MAG: CRISPR system precrRNA processing endoribonuclease RAMP protein Cas6 [Candidatus Omnitrophica bacterium]|nr:CRISPR system precrRNA processing endoribonuclease RAMP protein Cas6 [Candidatus Omnitrophota bacterium]